MSRSSRAWGRTGVGASGPSGRVDSTLLLPSELTYPPVDFRRWFPFRGNVEVHNPLPSYYDSWTSGKLAEGRSVETRSAGGADDARSRCAVLDLQSLRAQDAQQAQPHGPPDQAPLRDRSSGTGPGRRHRSALGIRPGVTARAPRFALGPGSRHPDSLVRPRRAFAGVVRRGPWPRGP